MDTSYFEAALEESEAVAVSKFLWPSFSHKLYPVSSFLPLQSFAWSQVLLKYVIRRPKHPSSTRLHNQTTSPISLFKTFQQCPSPFSTFKPILLCQQLSPISRLTPTSPANPPHRIPHHTRSPRHLPTTMPTNPAKTAAVSHHPPFPPEPSKEQQGIYAPPVVNSRKEILIAMRTSRIYAIPPHLHAMKVLPHSKALSDQKKLLA